MPWFQVALAALYRHNLPEGMGAGAERRGAFYDPSNFTFPAGCYICEVEVDPRYGQDGNRAVRGRRRISETIINPMIVEGQSPWRAGAGGHRPGVARGHPLRCGDGPADIGELHGLHHAARRRFGRLSRSRPPTRPVRANPLGIKGCGEAGAIGSPPAVINAITNAIGTNELTMPATPTGGLVGAEIGDTALRENHHCTRPTITVLPPVDDAVKLLKSTMDGKLLAGGIDADRGDVKNAAGPRHPT